MNGYIFRNDLQAVCHELNLKGSLQELLLQLGADSEGKISYEQFLQKRLDLKLEIDALKYHSALDTASDNSFSQGNLVNYFYHWLTLKLYLRETR